MKRSACFFTFAAICIAPHVSVWVAIPMTIWAVCAGYIELYKENS